MTSPRRACLGPLFTILLLPAIAVAGVCGDDVSGARVPCRCGDTVTGNVRLLPTDPVVTARCPLDGLVVRAGADVESITIDLAGNEIHGSQAGVGVRVVYGGTDGARIVGGKAGSRGAIIGFGMGLWATRTQSVARVEHLVLRANRNEGARLSIAGTVFENVVSEKNGGDGFFVNGTGGRFAEVVSTGNGENGLRLYSDNAAVNVVASDNARTGMIVDGNHNDLEAAEATGNGRDGIVVRGVGGNWDVARSDNNERDDLRANGHPPDRSEETK
jgi:hypothetical protein